MVSISSTGCGGRHKNIVNVTFSGVTSMMVKPFFSVGLSASSMPTSTSCEGFDSTLRYEDGKGISPVPSVPEGFAVNDAQGRPQVRRVIIVSRRRTPNAER
jgi:hypothetical protein